jgi:hypothetical protein
MSVGNTTTLSVTQLNKDLGTIAVAVRNDLTRALQFFQGVNSIGIAGLEGLGMSAQDATDFLNSANDLQTVASLYLGLASLPAEFDFDSALSEARGTQ